MNFSPIYRWGAITAAIYSICLQADYNDRISELERQMLEVGATNTGGTFGARFSPATPIFEEVSWDLHADVLLWHAKVGGTEFAISTENLLANGPFFPYTGNVQEIGFDWDFGFRAGIGVNFPEDGFDVDLEYTWYETSDSEHLRKNLQAGFFGLTGFLDPAQQASSFFKLDYDSIDLLLGRSYFISRMLLVHPSIGIQTTWIKQKQKSQYQFTAQSGKTLSFNSTLRDTCSFWGIGPEFKFASEWHFNTGFFLLNELSAALLYGYYKVKDIYHADQIQFVTGHTTSSVGDINLSGNCHMFSPFMQLLLGAGYGCFINNRRQYISISLSYEALYYWRQNEFLIAEGTVSDSSDPTIFNSSNIQFKRSAEDISFYGVTLRLSLEY